MMFGGAVCVDGDSAAADDRYYVASDCPPKTRAAHTVIKANAIPAAATYERIFALSCIGSDAPAATAQPVGDTTASFRFLTADLIDMPRSH
jgi:hypothetical protein